MFFAPAVFRRGTFFEIYSKYQARKENVSYNYDRPIGKAKQTEGEAMKNIELLTDSLVFIENNLGEDIRTENIAKMCFCSRSKLEKLFRYVYGQSVHDYIIRRRMMRAADLMERCPDMTILDVAVECGYSSNEAFTRAFRSVWQENPSEFRGSRRSELFPKLTSAIITGDDYIMTRKKFDISELYELFKERKNCWFVHCDIKELDPINKISRKAGDCAIITAIKRMDEAAGENDIVFRIGGDEFCMITASEDEAYAESIVTRIKSRNGELISCDGKDYPLSLHVGKMLYTHPLKYDELFTELHNAIRYSK